MIKPSHQRKKRPMKWRQVKYNANQVHVPAMRVPLSNYFASVQVTRSKEKQHVRSYCLLLLLLLLYSCCVLLVLLLLLLRPPLLLHVFTESQKRERGQRRKNVEQKQQQHRTANIYVYCSTRESADRGQSKILDPVSNRW